MMEICLANGEADISEVTAIADTIESMMGARPPIADLHLAIGQIKSEGKDTADHSSLDSLMDRLSGAKAGLDDNSREMILESAFRVACADGAVQGQEYELLLRIAEALGIYRGVLDIEIERFQRRLALSK